MSQYSKEEDEELGINRDLEEDKKSFYLSSGSIIFIIFALLFLGFLIWNLLKEQKDDIKEKIEKHKTNIEKKIFGEKVPAIVDLPIVPPSKTVKTVTTPVIKNLRIIKGRGNTIISSKNKDPNVTLYKPYRGGAYAIAGTNRFNPNLYIPKGTYIGCSLKNRIVSSLGGSSSCTVSNDIYSANGNVLLIEKGSVVTGSYKSGNIENGIERLYVLWEEIRTLNNIVVNVNSGSAGSLGASGIHGEVDNHWWYRFSSAVLLSIIDIAENKYISTNSTNDTVHISNLSTQAAIKFINIKPTLYINHGDKVGIYVNKDIDFSKVYNLKRKK